MESRLGAVGVRAQARLSGGELAQPLGREEACAVVALVHECEVQRRRRCAGEAAVLIILELAPAVGLMPALLKRALARRDFRALYSEVSGPAVYGRVGDAQTAQLLRAQG